MNAIVPVGETLGTRIRRARREKDWSLDRLARELGISKVSVWGWEAGKARPRMTTLEKLSEVLEIPLEVLVRGDGEPAVAALLSDCQNRIASAVGVPPDMVEIKITYTGAKA